MMKIVLLGKNGQVGQALQSPLASLGEVRSLDRTQVDCEDLVKVKTLADWPADVIVNAAAYTAVDEAEKEASRAFRVNAESVGVLADVARQSGALLVHYSTDYVFDGKKTTPYLETDKPNPLNVYGKSKLAGEEAIRQSGCRYLIFRTSWVYAFSGKNFIKTIWQLGKEQESLNVVADQIGAPTSADLIADVTKQAVSAFFDGRLPHGLYHLTAAGKTSWHGLACYLVRKGHEKGVAMRVSEAHVKPVVTEDFPRLAARPKNSCLSHALLSEKLGIVMPKWQMQVDALIAQLV